MPDLLVADPATPPTDPVAAAPATDAPASLPSAATPVPAVADPAAPPAVAPAVVVPETYDLKLPDGSTLDPSIVERTAATARALGLSNEDGQKLLDARVEDETARTETAATAQQAFVDSWKAGGENWKARVAEWETAAKADPEIAGTSGDQLATTLEKGQQALAKYGPDLGAYLKETGLGSNPTVIKFLARIGRAMSEPTLVSGTSGAVARKKSDAETMYPNLYNDDGSPKQTQ